MLLHKFPPWPYRLGSATAATSGSHIGHRGLNCLALLAAVLLSATVSAQTRPCDVYQICRELPAGTYRTANFAAPATFTLPAGWEFRRDTRFQLVFGRAADDPMTSDTLPVTLWVYKDVRALSQTCLAGAQPGVGLDAASLVQFWRSLPSIADAEPVPVTIAGLSGYMIDLRVDPEWTGQCDWSEGFPVAQLMYLPSPDTMHYGIYPHEYVREYVLDYGNGNITFDVINAHNSPLGEEAFHALALSIIESLEFAAP